VELLGRYSNRTNWAKLAQKREGPRREAQEARNPRQVARKLQPQEIESLAAEYLDGAGIQELATRYRVHRATVTVLLRRAGVAMRQRGMTADQVTESAQLYHEGWSVARIGEHFGVDGTTVWRSLRQQGVAMRKPYERSADGRRHVPAAQEA
jgi:transposase